MKKVRQFALAFLLVCCLALSVFAVTGCGGTTEAPEQVDQIYAVYQMYAEAEGADAMTYEQWLAAIKGEKGDTGAVGPQGPQGPQGEKGESGADLAACVHTYDTYVTMIEPTGTTVGFAYETCTKCEHQHIIVLDKYVGVHEENPLVLNATGVTEYEMIDGYDMLYVEYTRAIDGIMHFEFQVTDVWSDSAYTFTPDETSITYTNNYEEQNRIGNAGEKIYAAIAIPENIVTVAVTPVEVAYEAQEHTVTLFTSDEENYAGVAEVSFTMENPRNPMFPIVVASAPVVNGVATINCYPGEYNIQLEGFDADNFVVADEAQLVTILPVDGSNDEGADYTITLFKKYNYTVSVMDGATPVEGAIVGIHDVQIFYEDGTPAGYWDDPIKTVTTGADGTATLELIENIYYHGDTTEIGLYVLARYTGELGFAKIVSDVAVDTESNAINIVISDAQKAAIGETETALTFYAADAAHSVAYATVTATEAEASDYEVTINGLVNYSTVQVYVEGVDAPYTNTAVNNQVSFIVEDVPAATYNIKIVVNITPDKITNAKATFVLPEPPAAIQGTLLGLGTSAVSDSATYTFKSTVPGVYTFSFAPADEYENILFFEDEATSSVWGGEFWYAASVSQGGTLTYTVELGANEYFSFYTLTNDGEDKDITITAPATPATTALVAGDNTFSADGYYTFTAVEAGTYTFTDAAAMIEVAVDKANYDNSIYIYDPYNDSTPLSFTLVEGETYTVYIHFYEGTTIAIAKA